MTILQISIHPQRKDEKSGKWVEIGDKKAAEKTSQALREKTTEERDKVKSGETLAQGILLPGATNAYMMANFPSLLTQPGAADAKKEEKKDSDETKEAAAEASKTEENEEGKEEEEAKKEAPVETANV